MKNIISTNRIAISFLFLLVILSCKNTPESQNEESPEISTSELTLTEAQKELAEINTDSIRKMQISPSLTLRGKLILSPEYDISVHTPVEGFVKGLRWMPGQKVAKGQLLASIEDLKIIQLQQDFLTASVASYYTAREYERQKELYLSKAGSEKAFLQAEEVNALKVTEMNALREKLRLLNINPDNVNEKNIQSSVKIYAPATGYVTAVYANNGKYVQPNEPLFKISDEKGQFLMLKALENNLGIISVGRTVVAYSNFQPDKKINGTITQVNRLIDAGGSFDIYVKLNTPGHVLTEGSFFNVDIDTEKRDMYVLPEEAVLGFEGKTYLFTEEKQGTNYKLTEVETGITAEGMTEIKNGETFSNKRIVTKGAYTLLMKLKNIEE